ncbi:MAG TPA: hybrid sensor histidine kinase/response regulator, partial [Kofleriaceae bacterium]|nr:hybrid sensor histidine kinase/response regulator [Kofleriaceae bacterium]
RLADGTSLDDDAPLLDGVFDVLASLPQDIPFAAMVDSSGEVTHSAGLAPAHVHVDVELARRAARSVTAETLVLAQPLAAGPWAEPVTYAYAVPSSLGTFLFGVSARLRLDTEYCELFTEIVEHVEHARSRRQAFQVRAAAEAERRNLLLQAPVPMALLTGPNHVFELANQLYVDMVGRRVVGKAYLEAFPELRDTPLTGILDAVYRTGVPYVTEEQLVPLDRRGTGTPEPAYFKFNLHPIRDGSGGVYGMMAIAVDITNVVNAREEQALAHARLKRAHDEHAMLVRELESASRATDEFLAMLGHELRNPLAPIVTALDLAKLRDVSPSPENAVIRRQIDHLQRLVDDLLDVSKITQGKIELRREVVDMAAVIAKAVEMSSNLIERRHHKLDLDISPAHIQTWGDPVRLAQVVSNLLTNAARYTDPGGSIRLACRSVDGHIVIRVSDTGRGISAELLPYVFDLFVQGQRVAERSQGGLGLGLTLVKNFVALHGGTVAASSAGPGTGSEFVVTLPVTAAPARTRSTTGGDPDRGIPRRRVLLVDDNEDAAFMLGEMLRARGFDVAIANDAAQALDVFATFSPEIAILDIGLPVMDGYELAARLVSDGAKKHCRLVAVTGYGQARDRAR